AERDAVFEAGPRELAARPTVMIVEDLHWADDATLDVVRWLAWRIAELPSLLVVPSRDGEPGPHPPRGRTRGVLPRQDALRLEPRPLSAAAVGELSGATGADPGAVLGATGGNPSSSPRSWPTPRWPCRPRSATPCWPAWTASATPPGARWSCCRSSPAGPSA